MIFMNLDDNIVAPYVGGDGSKRKRKRVHVHNDSEGVDVDKEKWLEKEREVLHGRIYAFVACMRQVLGNRHFSKWKGSVVDSVAGAFLTQNVSDNLSSSAFMSLAAKFPLQSNGKGKKAKMKCNNVHACENCDDSTSSFISLEKKNISCNLQDCQSQTTEVPPKRKNTKEEMVHDWDKLRLESLSGNINNGRKIYNMDSLDWYAVLNASENEVSKAIIDRGMHNKLAHRIKDFLNRVATDHGSIDLEWLRNVPPEQAKEYFMSIYGLGLKSTECVRLLTLHHIAFPVDTNVARVSVRLGWVPLQPLPESAQLHLLNLYPVIGQIQNYLWPRLRNLDQKTLYELHYQMITFGKVFCTKTKPNCNNCPMRGECKHFASAYASARLALPGPEENRLVPTNISSILENERKNHHESESSSLQIVADKKLEENTCYECEPIIEEPKTPEHIMQDNTFNDNYTPLIEQQFEEEKEYVESLENDIEDVFWEDPDELPTMNLCSEEFEKNVRHYIEENNWEIGQDMSWALVALNARAASIPEPKLKNMGRLRTEHQVYELPDSHPLLVDMDQRVPDDPCPYLLTIWTPGETSYSTDPPKSCNSQNLSKLCGKETCFGCNSQKEAQSNTVRGTILIPCRTALRGTFPLNGTYFQVNEVFADHRSSYVPILVPRDLLWNLPRRIVYFGTSVTSIFRAMTLEEVRSCFWKGYICVRGIDLTTRAPKPLCPRLHSKRYTRVRGSKKVEREGLE